MEDAREARKRSRKPSVGPGVSELAPDLRKGTLPVK